MAKLKELTGGRVWAARLLIVLPVLLILVLLVAVLPAFGDGDHPGPTFVRGNRHCAGAGWEGNEFRFHVDDDDDEDETFTHNLEDGIVLEITIGDDAESFDFQFLGPPEAVQATAPIVVVKAGNWDARWFFGVVEGQQHNNVYGRRHKEISHIDFCYQLAKASPELSTSATDAVTGSPISDTATLSGGNDPTGTIAFELFDNAACDGLPVFTDDVDVNAGNNDYTSAGTSPGVGTYYWVASYSGDDNNEEATTACGDPDEISVISKAEPSLSTSATAAVTVGSPISDTATLSDGYNPTGTISFDLFDNVACPGLSVFTDDVDVNAGNNDYTSAGTSPDAGTYYWVASYSGDDNNEEATTACGEPGETSEVAKASPTISTVATEIVSVGTDIEDTATLSGGYNPTGNVTFTLYSDVTCETAVDSDAGAVDGGEATGTITSELDPGIYFWIASYEGDVNNNPVSGLCGDANETTEVFQFTFECGVPQEDSEGDLSSSFTRQGSGEECDDPKFGTMEFFEQEGVIQFTPSGGGTTATFIGVITLANDGSLTTWPILQIDLGDARGFHDMVWYDTRTLDATGVPITPFTCQDSPTDDPDSDPEPWCILSATIDSTEILWFIGGLDVDPRWR